ncbi:MAG: hypothetical protein HWD90_13360 [Campylobacteraceae bacterium]|nr:hypothetical protein [Campylobacteraceae bacterium]
MFILFFTAYEFYNGSITVNNIFLHKIAGIFLLVVTFIHILIRRKKLRKLTKEFFNIFSSNKEVTLDSDMDRLIYSLESKSLEELCTIFNITFNELNEIFTQNSIFYENPQQTLIAVSKQNSYKIFAIIVKIIEHKSC